MSNSLVDYTLFKFMMHELMRVRMKKMEQVMMTAFNVFPLKTLAMKLHLKIVWQLQMTKLQPKI